MHVDDFSNFAKCERLQILNSLLEEIALPLDDVVHVRARQPLIGEHEARTVHHLIGRVGER